MSVMQKLGYGPKYDIAGYDPMKQRIQLKVTPHPILNRAGHVTVELSPEQYDKFLRWKEGEGLIQNMLPDLTPDQQQLIQCGFLLT